MNSEQDESYIREQMSRKYDKLKTVRELRVVMELSETSVNSPKIETLAYFPFWAWQAPVSGDSSSPLQCRQVREASTLIAIWKDIVVDR